MIGQLEKTVIDCPDPRALAEFYAEVLGMRELAFQRADPYVAPRWPDPAHPQQLHLDIYVEDFDAAEEAVVALGAVRTPGEREGGFRVFADPAGHPFCLVHGRKQTADPRFR
jgi:hypothetical protein